MQFVRHVLVDLIVIASDLSLLRKGIKRGHGGGQLATSTMTLGGGELSGSGGSLLAYLPREVLRHPSTGDIKAVFDQREPL